MTSQFALMKDRRFLPLFLTMFLGAFNDNLFKTTLVVLLAYGIWDTGALKPEILVSAAAGLFILPYIILAPLGGTLADKFDKSRIMRALKITEIVIVLGVIAGLYLHSVPLLFLILVALGAQSALFSPAKFSIIPQHTKRTELVGANALINTGTFAAILLGNIIGSLWGVSPEGHMKAFGLLLACALVGFAASRFIPPAPPPAPDLKLRVNLLSDMKNNLTFAAQQHGSVMTVLFGIAWFYFVGGTFLAQFPVFARQTLMVDNFVLSIFMLIFTAGFGLGGLVNNRLLKGQVSARYIPLAIFGIAFFCIDIFLAAQSFKTGGDIVQGWSGFIASAGSWRIMIDVLMLAACGGLYVVPLNAILQDRAADAVRSRIISVGAVLNALFGLGSAIFAIILFSQDFRVEDLFFIEGLVSLVLAVFFIRTKKLSGDSYEPA